MDFPLASGRRTDLIAHGAADVPVRPGLVIWKIPRKRHYDVGTAAKPSTAYLVRVGEYTVAPAITRMMLWRTTRDCEAA